MDGTTPQQSFGPAPTGVHASGAEVDAAVLDSLEADLEAVDRAMASLDEISADPALGGDEAAAQIEAVVSPQRFVTTEG